MNTKAHPAPSRRDRVSAASSPVAKRRRIASLLPRRWDDRPSIEHHGSPSEMALRLFAHERGFHR